MPYEVIVVWRKTILLISISEQMMRTDYYVINTYRVGGSNPLRNLCS